MSMKGGVIDEEYDTTGLGCQRRISVFGSVRKIREQRWNMVKNKAQYAFIYEYLEHWVKK